MRIINKMNFNLKSITFFKIRIVVKKQLLFYFLHINTTFLVYKLHLSLKIPAHFRNSWRVMTNANGEKMFETIREAAMKKNTKKYKINQK